MPISLPRYPHRLERLKTWMDDRGVDSTVVFGPNNVNHLCGYSRYFGGPSALAINRDGRRTLAVMLDEEEIARELSEADEVIGYGERGFGIDLDPIAALVASLAAADAVKEAGTIAVSSELPGADTRLGAAIDAETIDAGEILHRLRLIKDEDELQKILASYELCWLAQKAVGDGSQPGAQEIEVFTAALSTAQIAAGQPIEFVADLLSGPNTAKVCCPIHVAGRRAIEQGDPVVADIVIGLERLLGGQRGDAFRRLEPGGGGGAREAARDPRVGAAATRAGRDGRRGLPGNAAARRVDLPGR